MSSLPHFQAAPPPCPAAVDPVRRTGISPGGFARSGAPAPAAARRTCAAHRHQPRARAEGAFFSAGPGRCFLHLEPNHACARAARLDSLDLAWFRRWPAINCELAAASLGPRTGRASLVTDHVPAAKPQVSSIHSAPRGIRLSPTADAYGNAKTKMPLETYCSSMHQPPTEDAYEGSILRWRRETTQK